MNRESFVQYVLILGVAKVGIVFGTLGLVLGYVLKNKFSFDQLSVGGYLDFWLEWIWLFVFVGVITGIDTYRSARPKGE